MQGSKATGSRSLELLAPAGDMTCMRAAVENGADAVYFGLDAGFNARARAENFTADSLFHAMEYLHRRAVRGYVTLNTLAFSNELANVESIVRNLCDAGVDAVLVQDLGVARLIREITSDLTLHASTQMTLTSAECIEVARNLGISRVVLPRELSIEEIRDVHAGTKIELEVFVHGALCVAYSGQCLTSESLGGRSANRGQCAQACRLPYEILCDDQLRDFGDQKYLLSPQDLAAYPLLQDLVQAGVSSFKIEGRLKTPEYVANITQHYRAALDAVIAGQPLEFTRSQVQQMEQSFSRGFSPGWLQGCDHKMLVPALSSAKRGVLLGKVARVLSDRVEVQLEYSVQAGDGVVFEGNRFEGQEQGGRVYHVTRRGQPCEGAVESGTVELAFARDSIDFSRIMPGHAVWKTDDPRLNQNLRRSFETADPKRRVPLRLTIHAETGRPLRVEAEAANGCWCRVESDAPLATAMKHPVTQDVFEQQLGRLGGTVFELQDLQCSIVGVPMVPLSVLGRIRRQMVDQLEATLPKQRHQQAPAGAVTRLRRRISWSVTAPPTAQLHLMCRTAEQVQKAVALRPDLLICDFQDLREYKEAVQAGRQAGVPVFLATPRIQKPGEMGLFRFIAKAQPDGVLVRNLSGLSFFRNEGIRVAGDYSLNVTNELTADYLMNQGLEWLTPSYDLNREQLQELVAQVPPGWLEVVMHQHMPMFHMEHCVFCAMLSPGTNKTNCGRPCDVHKVELRDRTGADHPLIADTGCRNTLFNAVAQSGAEVVPELLGAGVKRFRIELLQENAHEVERLIVTYRRLLDGFVTGEHVWTTLHAMNRVGVTRGTLEARRNPLAIL